MAEDNSQLINTLMGMLGDNPQEKINAVLNSLTSEQNEENKTTDSNGANDLQLNIPDLSALSKMQGLFSQLGGSDDDRTHLLLALKPFLSNQRKPHIDRAVQLLKLSKLAEAAKGMDILKDLKL